VFDLNILYYIILYVILVIAHNGDEPPKEQFSDKIPTVLEAVI
jgi:hypothetical protein